MVSKCSNVSASLQVLLLMCPLKLVDATDLLQAGQTLVRGAVGDGGPLGGDGGGDGDGDDMEGGGGGRVDREDDGRAAARRG